MRILEVSNYFKPSWETGGVTKVNYELSKGLVEKGHEVTVYTTDGYASRLDVPKNKPVHVDGIRVYYFYNLFRSLVNKMKFPTPYYAPFVLRKEIKNFDIIHIHEHRTLLAVFVCYYAKKYDVPYVVQAHGSVLPFFQKQVFKKVFDIVFGTNILHDASKVIALTNTEAEQYVKMGVEISNICIVPNGIRLEEYENLPKTGEFRKKYSIQSNEKVVLYLGRIDKIKGIDLLIDSFSELVDEFNEIKLVIVGPNSEYLSTISKKVNDFHLNDSVLFTGPLYGQDKLAAYVDADVYVLPSRYETFPNTVLEACLCGTPVIITDRCGISDIVNNNKIGYVVEFDKSKLKNAISMFFNDKINNVHFCSSSQITKDTFSWEKVLSQVECLYLGIKKSKPKFDHCKTSCLTTF